MDAAIAWTPHEYQLRAVEGMVSKPGFALFAEPGLGKTSSTLASYLTLKEAKLAKAMLVVAPMRPVYKVWPAEIKRWLDFNELTCAILHGPNKLAALQSKVDVYLINYEGLPWLMEQLAKMKEIPFDILVLDESHKAKNTNTVRFKTLKQLRAMFSRVWALTGTPAPQGIGDLFGQIYLIDGGQRLGKFVTHFRREYFHEFPQRGGYSLWELRKGSQEKIEQVIADCSLSLKAEDYLKLPRLIEKTISVDLPADALRVYKGLEDDFFAELASGQVTAANAAAKSMKLRQVTGGGVYGTEGHAELHSAKVDALLDLIEEQAGQPLLVAVQFTHEVDRIRAALKQDVPYLGDGISAKELDRHVDDWNAGKIPVLLAHPSTVALGLNMQSGGNAMVWFSLTWSMGDYKQMIARIWRQGQTKPCVIHYLIAQDTIDERVLEVVKGKERTQGALMNALRDAARR